VAAARVGVEVAADDTELLDAAAQLGDRAVDRDAGGLRELADTDEALGVQLHHPGDQIVADLSPAGADGLVPDVVPHRRGAGGEDGQVDAALGHEAQLAGLDRLADLVVGDCRVGRGSLVRLERGALRLAPRGVRGRGGRVVAVAIDDHVVSPDVDVPSGGGAEGLRRRRGPGSP
jgi:hypothetical protein